jgi:hypothetical protein
VEQVSKDILAVFQIGTGLARNVGQLYDVSRAKAPDAAVDSLLDGFGEVMWAMLEESVIGQDILVGQARNPDLINPSFPDCDQDMMFLGGRYFGYGIPSTTGVDQAIVDNSSDPWVGSDSLVLNRIKGHTDPRNPLEISSPFQSTKCTGTVAGSAYTWASNWFKGTPGVDTGLQTPQWRNTLVVPIPCAMPCTPQFLVRQAVYVPLPGPSWAPNSAYARASVRVAGNGGSGSDVNLERTLKEVADSSRDTTAIFLLTNLGELLASSYENGAPIIADTTGPRVTGRLARGDDEVVPDPVRSIAKSLMDSYCSLVSDQQLYCAWPDETLQYLDNFVVVTRRIDDPEAAGLGLLLVDVVDVTAITERIDEIEAELWVLGTGITIIAVFLFMILSRQVTVPLRIARDNMFLLSDMKTTTPWRPTATRGAAAVRCSPRRATCG